MPTRPGPLATAQMTTVSPYWASTAAWACLARKPVSREKTLLPICFSTLTFTGLSTFTLESRRETKRESATDVGEVLREPPRTSPPPGCQKATSHHTDDHVSAKLFADSELAD